MKAKAKKPSAKKVVSSKKVVAKNSTNSSWIIGMLVVLALVAMWQFNKPAMEPQSLDINKVETGVVREYDLAKWTFDTESDFGNYGSSATWRLPSTYKDYKGVSLQGGKLVWSNVAPSAQLVGASIPLNVKDAWELAGSYVVKVKAEHIEQALTPKKQADPTATVTNPHNFTMKVALIRVFTNPKGVNQEEVLATPTISGTTNAGMKDYEFVIPKSIRGNVTRIRFYPYETPTLSLPHNPKTDVRLPSTRTTFYLDEMSVVQRLDAIPERPEHSAPPKRTAQPQRTPMSKPELRTN